MNRDYDEVTAFHYASYRPLLHKQILNKCLGTESFNLGLDIGCGTGQSTIALVDYCNNACGIEPSASMLSKAIPHPKVSYSLFENQHIDFNGGTFEIITMAGSLWYAKSQQLLDEIIRVGQKKASIAIYDFEILLDNKLAQLGYSPNESDNPYNHQEDFTGLNTEHIALIEKSSEKVSIKIAVGDLAHLILSVKDWYISLMEMYGQEDLYKSLVEKLSAKTNSDFHDIQADTYFTLYRLR